MMAEHISQTITYSVDLLKGDYAQSIVDYDLAEAHMDMMADTLTQGIIAQFPKSFHGGRSRATECVAGVAVCISMGRRRRPGGASSVLIGQRLARPQSAERLECP